MTMVARHFLTALRTVFPDRERVGLHEPLFAGNEWTYARDCLDSGWVSSVGNYVDRFEDMARDYTGAVRAVAVVNGTCGLHAALVLAGVRPGDEVVVPALTFVATANAVSVAGAVPHFVDSEDKTLGMDPVALASHLGEIAEMRGGECFNRNTGRRIQAMVPVHVFGHVCDVAALAELGQQYGLTMVEDAAGALGSFRYGKHAGTFGPLGVISFNGNKTLTTGGGGVIVTNHAETGALAKHLTTTAKVPHQWEFIHDHIGFNFRMPNINAALGCAQMEDLESRLESKRSLAGRYADAFAGGEGMRLLKEPAGANSNYWLNAVLLDEPDVELRNDMLASANKAGFQCRPVWRLLHRLPIYEHCPRAGLATAENLESRVISLPSSPQDYATEAMW